MDKIAPIEAVQTPAISEQAAVPVPSAGLDHIHAFDPNVEPVPSAASDRDVTPDATVVHVGDNEHEQFRTPLDHQGHHDDHPAQEPPVGPGKRLTGILAAVVLVGCLLALGIGPRMKQEKKLAAEVAVTKATAVPVNIVLPHYARASSEITLPGSIQAIEEATINARTSGYLRKRYVDIGSRVHTGQTLALIESPEVDEQLMQARAETAKSQAGGEQAVADVSRLAATVAQAQAEQAGAESNLQATRADLAHMQAKELEAQGAVMEAEAKLVQSRKRLNARQSDLDKARTHLKLAEITYKRWQELAKGGAVSGQDLDETEAAYQSSQSSVIGAQADVESARADVDAAQAAVRSSQGNVAAAQADINAAREKIGAAQAAVTSSKANITATQAAEQASRANVRATTANVAASQADVNRYAALKGFEQVVAPFNGVITARNLDVGALINAGSSPNSADDPTRTVPHTGIFGIARTDVLRIQVNVPEAYIGDIKTGQAARILVQELPGRVFWGTVARKAGALDASSRTMLMEVHIPNPTNSLIPGMYAQVQFIGKGISPLLRVPANTLIIDSAGIRVATVTKDNTVHFQNVHLGRDYGKEAEITQGLGPKERLVENPTDDLIEGTPVEIVTAGK